MESEKRSEASLEVESDSKHNLRINKLAKISMFIGIGSVTGNIYMFSAADYDLITVVFLSFLVMASIFGAFCGHCACRPEAGKPYPRIIAGMAVIGIICCYLCIGWGLFLIWVLFQGTV